MSVLVIFAWSTLLGVSGTLVPLSSTESTTPRWSAMVIGLTRRPDRLERFAKAIWTQQPWIMSGNHLCRIEGRDGRELSPPVTASVRPAERQRTQKVARSLRNTEELIHDGWVTPTALATAEADKSAWPKMTAGGLGLYLGHADAWQRIVDMNLDYGLIFEDDLTLFSHSFRSNVTAALSGSVQVPGATAPWDMLYLQRCDDAAWLKERTFTGPPVRTSDTVHRVSEAVPIQERAVVPCTGAYILSRKGAEKLLSGALPADMQLDQQLSSVPGLIRSALSPPVAQCHEIFTDANGKSYRDTDVQKDDDADAVKNIGYIMDVFDDINSQKGFGKRSAKSLRSRSTLLSVHDLSHIPNCGS